MAEHDGAEHDALAQLLRLRFDHQHAFAGAGNEKVELRVRQLVDLWIEHVLAVDIADARAADRAEEGNAGDRQRRRRADQRDDVGIVLEIMREHGADYLRLVEKARREKRADRPVDEARGQRLLLRGATLALEEAARDLARGEGLLLVVHREREEILPRLGLLHGDRGAQHGGLAVGREHGAVGLAGDAAGFENEAASAPHQLLAEYLGHLSLLSLLSLGTGMRRRASSDDAARLAQMDGPAAWRDRRI